MRYQVEDLEDQTRFRQIMAISYNDLIQFVFDHLRRKSALIITFWSVCLIILLMSIRIRMNMAGYYPSAKILFHSILGLIVFPVLCIPVHELLHILPYYISGARKIRVGMDMKQFLFYVTAHRFVAAPRQFKIVAIMPFLFISTGLLFLIFFLPGPWKWSLSVFMFVHATMCAGDVALLNFYFLKRDKEIYTWDDADLKIAYFYEKV